MSDPTPPYPGGQQYPPQGGEHPPAGGQQYPAPGSGQQYPPAGGQQYPPAVSSQQMPPGGGSTAYPPGGPPAYPQGGSSSMGYGSDSSKGFFGALFDFSFSSFVTPKIVKLVYILATVAIVIGVLIFVIAGFAQSAGAGLAALILAPIIGLIYLAFIRMTLEFYFALVRMSEDIHHRLPRA